MLYQWAISPPCKLHVYVTMSVSLTGWQMKHIMLVMSWLVIGFSHLVSCRTTSGCSHTVTQTVNRHFKTLLRCKTIPESHQKLSPNTNITLKITPNEAIGKVITLEPQPINLSATTLWPITGRGEVGMNSSSTNMTGMQRGGFFF